MNRLNQIQTHFTSVPGTINPAHFKYSAEVQKALNGSPRDRARLVALESTIISHGMPYPDNVACAKSLENIVREGGGIPATIAILDGVIHVGLDEDKLELLGKLGSKCAKCSRRDLPLIVAQKANGATTVTGTILIAAAVGIAVMATGGIGGVHRKGESTMDVSADLTELGRTQILVVCAGVKSILDIGRTLEYLETQGVAVMAYQTDEFPAFFTRTSGCKAPLRLENSEEGGAYVHQLKQLGFASGGLLGVPIPKENEGDGELIEKAIQQSIRETEEKNISGRDITPYILKRVNELTKGKSLKSNIALVRNNTKVATQIAVNYASRLQK